MNLTNALLVTTPYLNATPLPHYPPMVQDPPAYREFVPGPGLFLTNGWITIHPERRTGLPGTPREGEVLTTEEAVLRPCFAAVYPACPGHLHTNLTRWRWTSGAWDRIWETNSIALDGTSVTNLITTDSIVWTTGATNLTARLLSKTGALVEKFWNLPPNAAPFGASPSDFIDLLDAFREDLK